MKQTLNHIAGAFRIIADTLDWIARILPDEKKKGKPQ